MPIKVPWLSDKPETKSILDFFRKFSRYHRNGRKPEECVTEYLRTSEDENMNAVLRDVKRSLGAGLDFAAALRKTGDAFPAYVTEFIAVGERTNQLDAFVDKICDRIKKDLSVQRKIKNATLMPKISIIIILAAFIFAIYYMIPKINEVFKEIDTELPALTRAVLAAGDFFTTFWFLLPGIAIIGIAVFRWYKKTHPTEYSLLGLRVPFFRDLIYTRLQYNFCDVFALCMSSGVPANKALQFTAMAIDNRYLHDVLLKASELMDSHGLSVASAIQRTDVEQIISHEIISMLETGIATSKTGDIMADEASSFKDELDSITESIGDKISAFVLVPTYGFMLLLFFVIEYPLMNLSTNISAASKTIGM